MVVNKAVAEESTEELQCTWTGSLKDMDHHLSTTCPFTTVNCTSCRQSMQRHQLDAHMTIHAETLSCVSGNGTGR